MIITKLNAKELILKKINAGSKLAKCYLFLITMGFDIRDIAAFMTSPVIDFIDNMTESNIYQESNLYIDDAIDLLNGKIPNKLIYKFLDKKVAARTYSGNLRELIISSFKNNTFDELELPANNPNLMDFVSELRQIRELMPEMDENAKADLKDFLKVLEGADEFSNFGRLLGINLGIKTSEDEFKKYLQFIKSIITDREKKLKLTNKSKEELEELGYDPELVNKFDVYKWLYDKEYRERIKSYYNKIKVAIPIFDIIDNIKLYEASYTLLDVANVVRTSVSLKTKVRDLILDNHSTSSNWSERFRTNLIGAIHSKFIQLFLYSLDVKLPYLGLLKIKDSSSNKTKIIPGATILNVHFDTVEAPENSFITFDSVHSLASFKYVFENYIIPKLKDGKYITVEDGKIVEKSDKMKELKENKFIQGLVKGEDKDIPLYRANIDMINYDTTPEGNMKMLEYIQGLLALLDIDINGVSLTDWFILYNLYVNHNNYGSNRLTTLFDSFIDNSGQSSIIKDYLNYLGRLCYTAIAKYDKENQEIIIEENPNDGLNRTFVLKELDLFMMSAISVISLNGKKDPVVRLKINTGSVFYSRTDEDWYKKIPNSFFEEKTSEKTVDKQNIINGYVTTGGISDGAKVSLISKLSELTEKTNEAISKLLTDHFFELYKICK